MVDAAAVDGRRRLVIVRRDNVEHLLMIGGPTDVLVEANIVRAAGAAREKIEPTMTRPAAPADLRPGTAAESSLWPLQPQAENNQRAARTAATEEATLQWTAWPTQPEAPPPAPGRGEGFSGLTDDIGRAAAPREVAPSPRKPAATARSAPPVAAPAEPVRTPEGADKNLAEMAQRLEAALRRPPEPMPGAERTKPTPEPTRAPAETAKPEAPAGEPKKIYDSLEQEMASLLGRPQGKT